MVRRGYTPPAPPPPTVDDLDNLKIERYSSIVSVGYKTVDTFSGITRQKLWLKDGPGGATDGHEITAPFGDAFFYQIVEHELSHVLFQSDAVARKAFIAEYGKRIADVAGKAGVKLAQEAVQDFLGAFTGVLEDHRVLSLWSVLYEGSGALQREMIHRTIETVVSEYPPEQIHQLIPYFTCLLDRPDPSKPTLLPPGPMDRFRPIMETALNRVERRGFGATLIICKWLVTNLVNEVIREAKEYPPEPPPPQQLQQQQGPSGQQRGPQGGAGKNDPGDGMDVDNTAPMPGEHPQSQPQPQPKSQPQATPQERAQALQRLVDAAGSIDGTKAEQLLEDVKEPKFQQRGQQARAEALAEAAMRLNVNDQKELDDFLAASRGEMDRILKEAQNALRQRMTEDEWIKKDAFAKVIFKDVKARDVKARIELKPEDQETVNRLRATFLRVMGKRRTTHEETGTSIDPIAYVQGRIAGRIEPCFLQDITGRGFKSLVLLDRSGSMGGAKKTQAERACRIVSKALQFPFVDLAVWGFQSFDNAEVDITRFDPRAEGFDAEHAHVGGLTPLHIAIRLAVRYMEQGTETKQLIVVTDGFPVHNRRDGRAFGTGQLMSFCREEVRRGRQHGVNVTGVMIGSGASYDVSAKQMEFVFGSNRNWKFIDSQRVGTDLVSLVSQSFMKYLRSG